MFPYLVGYMLIFSEARRILEAVRKLPPAVNLVQFIVVNAIAIVKFVKGIFETSPFWAYLIGMVCACSIFALSYNLLKSCKSHRLMVWLSGISFEVYLVHEFFIGRFNVYALTPNPIIGFSLLVIFSILTAYIIHQISHNHLVQT